MSSMLPPNDAALWSWKHKPRAVEDAEQPGVIGYKVVANDGEIGKIDSASTETDRAHVVVDMGTWLIGRKTLIPAGAIRDINHESETVQVDLTKDEIKDAPDYDASAGYDNQRVDLSEYYGGFARW